MLTVLRDNYFMETRNADCRRVTQILNGQRARNDNWEEASGDWKLVSGNTNHHPKISKLVSI
jgi:hypothetical protein